MSFVPWVQVLVTCLVHSLIEAIRGVIYAPEYPNQIYDLVQATEGWKETSPSVEEMGQFLSTISFAKCKRDCMIQLIMRCCYSHGLNNPVWKSTIKRAYKEILSRGLDPKRALIGMLEK